MKLVIVLFFLAFMKSNQAPNKYEGHQKQKCVSYYDSLLKKIVYDSLDSQAIYIGGELQLLKYIMNNLNLSQHELDEGKIYMCFIISDTGKILRISFEKNIYESLKIKIIRLFEGNNNWIPGMCGNKKVVSKYRFTFRW